LLAKTVTVAVGLGLIKPEDLDQVRDITDDWITVYNEERPHGALGKLPPRLFRQQSDYLGLICPVRGRRSERIQYRLDNGKLLFDNFSLDIKAGEKIGLIGHSGAGKTTLLRLLRRHFDLHGGRILIDGQDIAQVTLNSLAQAIAVVPQDPALFHRSLRQNIVYARPNASQSEIDRAIALAHCEDFINARKEGLEAIVGERGVKLCGGERQRIALAQAFLKDAPILLLDEATSALDPETEAKIQQAIDALCENRTVIAIAHRHSTLSNMDRIIDLGSR
jgi:ATP-binding cassette, subfamily B, bacterial